MRYVHKKLRYVHKKWTELVFIIVRSIWIFAKTEIWDEKMILICESDYKIIKSPISMQKNINLIAINLLVL